MDQSDFNRVFELAIGREVEAHSFYREVAGRVTDRSVRALFEQLAAEEKGHEELLWKLKADPTAPLRFTAPPEFRVAETVELPPITAEMKPADALALAMKKEQQAMELYRQLADWCDDPETKRHYENLALMEQGHKHRLEKLYVDVGYPEVW